VAVSFRILGIPVSIGYLLPLALAVMGMYYGFSPVGLAIWVVAGMTAVLLHELGHALAFRRYGLESSIQFWILGGVTIPTDQAAAVTLRETQILLVALAGPFVGLALGIVGLAIQAAVAGQADEVRFAAFIWTFVNLGWGLFNLLPITGLDGGQALQHLLLAALGKSGRPFALLASIVASAAVAVVALIAGIPYVAFIAIVFGVANPYQYRALMDAFFPERARRRQLREAATEALIEQQRRLHQAQFEPPSFDDEPGRAWPDE
jgi:stage IV sporulation protein FB